MSKLGPRFFAFVFLLLLAFALLRCDRSSTKVKVSSGKIELQWEEHEGKLWVRTVQNDTLHSFWKPFEILSE